MIKNLIDNGLVNFEDHKDSTGKKIYHKTGGISELWGREDEDPSQHVGAVARLANAGIKGIKYLDRSSRAAGEGSRNYVVFDDKLVNVKRKYEQGGRVGYADGGDSEQPKRDLSPMGFYSHAAETAQNFPQAKGTPQQFKSMLRNAGVRPAEIENSGYDEAFADRPSVTRDEIAQHFKQSMPRS